MLMLIYSKLNISTAFYYKFVYLHHGVAVPLMIQILLVQYCETRSYLKKQEGDRKCKFLNSIVLHISLLRSYSRFAIFKTFGGCKTYVRYETRVALSLIFKSVCLSVCLIICIDRVSVLLGCMSFGVCSLKDPEKVSSNTEIIGTKAFCKHCPNLPLQVSLCLCVHPLDHELKSLVQFD